jgi:hypothetical protein
MNEAQDDHKDGHSMNNDIELLFYCVDDAEFPVIIARTRDQNKRKTSHDLTMSSAILQTSFPFLLSWSRTHVTTTTLTKAIFISGMRGILIDSMPHDSTLVFQMFN